MRNIQTPPIIKKPYSLLIHPITLSLIVTLIILVIFPLHIPKHQLKIEQSFRNTANVISVWEDLENDGVSDHILISQDPIGYAVVGVYFFPSGRVKEWDVPGKLLNFYNNDFFVIGEAGHGRNKNIFAFSQNHDSIFLNRISDFSIKKPIWTQKFITTFRRVQGKSDARILKPRLEDLDQDGTTDLVFGITSGFSISPRALFVYKLEKDTVFRSIETGNFLSDFLIADLTGDNKREVITSGYSPGNILDTIVPYHDSSNWTMVFDHHLKLIAPPAEFRGRTGSTRAITFPNTASFQELFVYWHTPTNSKHGAQLYQIKPNGGKKLIKEFNEFDKKLYAWDCFFTEINNDCKFVLPMTNGDLMLFDTSFMKYNLLSLNQPVSFLQQMDVDLDGQPEILVFDIVSKMLTIYRKDFTHPASINVESAEPQKTTISLKKKEKYPPLISLCAGNFNYILSYQKNPYWIARWGLWGAIWLAVFLFTLMIRIIQRTQLEKQFSTEKKITELQLKIVRNQMDPHFTMNAINAVVDAINREEKEQARENLLHFSQMYRSLVLSADKIKRTLQEELDFTENYLALERFRFGGRFTYNLRIYPEVDQGWEVPKMVIQSPVENAVKHGLLNKETGGEINILVRVEDHKLILEITDNGVGRAASAKSGKTSTGKGMEIMEQFFNLYYKITGVKVQSSVTDLVDGSGNPAGTRVVVIIPLP